MTRLDTELRALVRAHLERSGLSGRRFGAEALGDPGFVASLAKGRRLTLKTADRVLAFVGAAPIGDAFRREVEAFLTTSGTKVYVLGEQAARDPSFVERLRRGASFRLETVDRVRGWIHGQADAVTRDAMRRAVAGAALLEARGGGANHTGTRHKGETEMKNNEGDYLSTRRAAAFLGLSPRTLDRYRGTEDGPAYHRFGQRILYHRADLEAWAAARRIAGSGRRAA